MSNKIMASLHNLVGIEIDNNYPWLDSLTILKGVARVDENEYYKCRAYIEVQKKERLDLEDCRDLGQGVYISKHAFVDMNYGIRIERPESNKLILKVTQECNEWLIICLQIMLLELDATLIHAAALEKEGQVLLLPSWGGVGKTATVVRMINEKGWRLLGDDLIVLHKGNVLPYLKPFVIYPYHKDLFPKVFEKKKKMLVNNLEINSLMSKFIPPVKKILRLMPSLLAFARKHNPQSMRVNPREIFEDAHISTGGALSKIIWLERIKDKELVYEKIDPSILASKTVAVTCLEIFSERLRSAYILFGSGIVKYEEVQVKMYNIVFNEYKNLVCRELDIPTTCPITEVGKLVYDNITLEG